MLLTLILACGGSPKDSGTIDTGAADSGNDSAAETGGDTGDTVTDTADTDTADSASDTADSGGDSGGDTADSGGDTAAAVIPDFALPDLNPGSPRYGQTVSPRDYLRQVSGWYFVRAT